jgi:hypothetical protein
MHNFLPHLILCAALLPHAQAALVFTDPIAFDNAVTAQGYQARTTLNFDTTAVGTLIPTGSTLQSITFTYALNGLQLFVADDFDTTSGTRYLGVDDPANFNQLVAGDELILHFPAQNAIGLFVIATADPQFDGDMFLETQIGTAFSVASPLFTLPDTGHVRFIGIVGSPSDAQFTQARLGFGPGASGAFLYNVDDIMTATTTTVPEPVSGIAVSLVMFCMLFRRMRAM